MANSLRDEVEALRLANQGSWLGEHLRQMLDRHDSEPRCTRPEGCVCGGDTEPVRMACSWMEKPKPQTGHPAADGVLVPRDLLSDLRDLASDAVIHHHGAMAGHEPEVHAENDRIIEQADAILAKAGA